MDIIKQLKHNKSNYGLMTTTQRAECEKIGILNFLYYNGKGWDRKTEDTAFDDRATYRLCEDYGKEPEVVKVPEMVKYGVFDSEAGLAWKIDNGDIYDLHQAPSDPNFIGFLYENDEDYIRPDVRMYRAKNSRGSDAVHRVYVKNVEQYEVLTPEAVLFKGKK